MNYIPDKRIKVKVVDNRHIEYKGEITSLTAVAKQLLNRSRGVIGPQYWMFNGTPLLEMEKSPRRLFHQTFSHPHEPLSALLHPANDG